MIFAEWAILLLGSLKMRALCAIYLASQINAERRLRITRSEEIHTNIRRVTTGAGGPSETELGQQSGALTPVSGR